MLFFGDPIQSVPPQKQMPSPSRQAVPPPPRWEARLSIPLGNSRGIFDGGGRGNPSPTEWWSSPRHLRNPYRGRFVNRPFEGRWEGKPLPYGLDGIVRQQRKPVRRISRRRNFVTEKSTSKPLTKAKGAQILSRNFRSSFRRRTRVRQGKKTEIAKGMANAIPFAVMPKFEALTG